jgi:hypothetical protein
MISGLDTRYEMPAGVGHPLLGSRMPDLDLRTPEGPARLAELLRSGRGLLLDCTDRRRFSGTGRCWEDRVGYVPASSAEPAGFRAALVRPDGLYMAKLLRLQRMR